MTVVAQVGGARTARDFAPETDVEAHQHQQWRRAAVELVRHQNFPKNRSHRQPPRRTRGAMRGSIADTSPALACPVAFRDDAAKWRGMP